MIPEWLITYVGGGLLIVIGYVIISNTFWLLFGSTLLTKLPGVNQEGARGTLKIALLLLLCLVGFLRWLIVLPFQLFYAEKNRVTLKGYISISIQAASRWHQTIIGKDRNNEQ